jgi:hypothetical protein
MRLPDSPGQSFAAGVSRPGKDLIRVQAGCQSAMSVTGLQESYTAVIGISAASSGFSAALQASSRFLKEITRQLGIFPSL